MDHFFQIRGVGPATTRCSRAGRRSGTSPRHHHARPPRPDGRRRPLPRTRAVGQGRHDARRPVRRPRLAGHRCRLERRGVAAPRVPLPAARRRFELLEDTLRMAARHVRGRARQPGALRRPPRRRRAGCSTSRSRSAGRASRSWSAAAARRRPCGSWRSTPTRATSSAARWASITSTKSCASTARPSAVTHDEIERSTLQDVHIGDSRPPRGDRRRGRPALRRARRRWRAAPHPVDQGRLRTRPASTRSGSS